MGRIIRITEKEFKTILENILLKEYQGLTARQIEYPLSNEFNDFQYEGEILGEVFDNVNLSGNLKDINDLTLLVFHELINKKHLNEKK